jgi:hypothetical protein
VRQASANRDGIGPPPEHTLFQRVQPPGGKPGLTAIVYHSELKMAIVFWREILNFKVFCYKNIKNKNCRAGLGRKVWGERGLTAR